jgi:carbonic anhydrase
MASKILDEVMAANAQHAGRSPHPRASARSTQHPIYGYVYDVKTGRLNEVAKATEAGRAT